MECLWPGGGPYATKNGVGIEDDGGERLREREEDVSHRDAEFNHSHTIPKQAVSELLKTVLCLLKVVINVSALVNNDRMCRIWWRVSELQDVSLCRRWYILLRTAFEKLYLGILAWSRSYFWELVLG